MYQNCELGSVSFVQGCVASSKEALTVLGLDPRECVIERDEILVVGRKQEAKTYHLSFRQNVTPNSTRVDSPEPTMSQRRGSLRPIDACFGP